MPFGFADWHALYASELQGVWALWVVPAVFFLVVWRQREMHPGAVPGAAPFVRAYALVFAIETMLDPFAGGPLLRWLGLAGGTFATVVMVAFVLLGDFRVLLLVFALLAHAPRGPAPPSAAAVRTAALVTFVVPVAAVVVEATLRAVAGPLPAQSIWLVYELGFLALALVLRTRVVPARVPTADEARRRFLRAVLAYVAVYYALWATADVLIMGIGPVPALDAGWGLRIVPNQLYYSWYLPFVYVRFFGAARATPR